jgi:cation:H+ antiporter
VAILCALAGIGLRLEHVGLPPLAALCAFGGAVLAAAFLLAWAAEALQVDISKGLAMAVLAFIAVLPEYAVDLYFAATAARNPTYAQYAAANMTGSNRLLIGVGWSLVALCSIYVHRGRLQGKTSISVSMELTAPAVKLAPGYGVDLTVLGLATLWSLFMPLLGRIALWHGIGMLSLFAFYIWRVSGSSEGEPDLAGVARDLGHLKKGPRRLTVGMLLLLAMATLLAAAKPFAESLIDSGAQLGIDRFLLVQWLAPLASEAPELLVATIFAMHGHGPSGISALLSSKVNQWTLLVGTLPIAYSVSLGHVGALPLDTRQTEELVLTASQSLLGIAFLLNGRLEGWKAILLLVLFLVQLPFTHPEVRYSLSLMYVVLAACFLAVYARHIPKHVRLAFDLRRPQPAGESGASGAAERSERP